MDIVRAIRAAVGSSQSSSLDDPGILAPARAGRRLWLPLVAVITTMLCMPFFRLIAWVGDEGVLLNGAERMLQGSKLYTDFFEFLPPGGFVLTAAWFSVAGISFPSARVLAILTIVATACLTYLVCRQVSRNAPLSAFLVIGWAFMSQDLGTQVSHHWFTTLFSMIGAWAAVASLEPQQRLRRWPLIAGVATGAAAMITPTRGALAVLAALMAFLNLRKNRAGAITYVLAVALVPAGFVAYLAVNHSLAAAFYDVVQFPATRYASIHGVPFGYDATLAFFPLLSLFPVAALLTLLVCARDWRASLRDRLLHLCAAFGLAGFIGCFPHPDIGHIAYTAPLACPLLAYCITRLTQRSHRVFQYVFAAAAIWICVMSFASSVMRAQAVLDIETVPTQRGGVKILKPAGTGEMLARIAATPPGDAYFFYPYMPLLPFLADREHVSKYDIFVPAYTLPSQYHDACLSAMRQADWLVIDWTWIGPKRWKEAYPAMQNAQPQETVEFERALDRGFEFVGRDETFELRRRRKDTSDAICTSFAN